MKKFLKKIRFLVYLNSKLYQIKKYLYIKTYSYVSDFYRNKEITRLSSKLINGEKIKVAFLVLDISVWKTDTVFKAMMGSDLYDPFIVAIPRTNLKDPLTNAIDVYNHFKEIGYKTYLPYDSEWIDLNQILQIDIIFISNPHDLTDEKYYIKNFLKKLTCYVPYFEQICTDYEGHFNNLTVNLCWKNFQINDVHLNIAKNYSINKGRNINVVGYPAAESLINKSIPQSNPWKDNNKKKVIIAPHHSISNSTMLSNSTFLEYAEAFIEIADFYKEDVCFAFKPHPLYNKKYFYTINFIEEVKLNENLFLIKDNKNLLVLEKLCKKLDVIKKVYTVYDEDLLKKININELSPIAYKKLSLILIYSSAIYDDIKFLNTVLKMKINLIEINESEEILDLINNLFILFWKSHENS